MKVSARLAGDVSGSAVVEFAYIAPLMILMICGFMEYAHLSSARTTLEAATMRAARAVAATDCPSARDETMLEIIQEGMKTVPSADGEKAKVVTKAYSGNFSDIEGDPFKDLNNNKKYDPDTEETFEDINGNGEYDLELGTIGSIGGAGQVVSYKATYKVASLFKFVSQQFGGGDSYTIEASTVIRNEPVFRTTGCT